MVLQRPSAGREMQLSTKEKTLSTSVSALFFYYTALSFS